MQLSSPQVKGFRHRQTQRFNRMSCLAPPSLGSLLASASASVLVGPVVASSSLAALLVS